MPRFHPYYRTHKCLNVLRRWTGLRFLAGWLRAMFAAIALLSTLFLALLPFCDPADSSIPAIFKPAIATIRMNQFPIACWLLGTQVATGMSAVILRMFDERWLPNISKLEQVLNSLVDAHFESKHHDHTYRATLFRAHRFWPCGRWLGIVARSGTTYSKSSTIFSISLTNRDHNTGVAGECWWRANSRTAGQFYLSLPPQSQDAAIPTTGEYNGKGHLALREITQFSVRACFFRAIAIRQEGKVWGVLVIDCTEPWVPPDGNNWRGKEREDFRQKLLEQVASTITLLIE